MLERTCVIIKPDAVRMEHTKAIIARYEAAGLQIVMRQEEHLTYQGAGDFYDEHRGKCFFVGLCLGMSCGPIVALTLQGENAIQRVRELNGATNPKDALPGTIRADFRSAGGPFNTVHGSENTEAARREINFFQACRGLRIER